MPFTGGEGPVQVLFFGKTAYIIIPFQSNDTYSLFSTTYIVYGNYILDITIKILYVDSSQTKDKLL
jgi:hypothetical protein